MFQVCLCKYYERQKLYTIKSLTNASYFDCVLQDNCSLKNPVIDIVAKSPITIESLLNFNYAIIKNFGRCYFIDDYEIITSTLVRFYLSCDLISSCRNIINNASAYVIRWQGVSSNKVRDDLVTFNECEDVSYQALSLLDGKTFNTNASSYTFMVAVLNDLDNLAIADNPEKDYSPNRIDVSVSGLGLTTHYYRLSWFNMVALAKRIYNNDTYLGYIKHITAYPIQETQWSIDAYWRDSTYIYNIGDDWYSNMRIGSDYVQLNKTTSEGLLERFYEPYIPNHRFYLGHRTFTLSDFDATSGEEWEFSEPYRKYKLWLPYYDFIDINFKDYYGKNIGIYYTINYDSGESNVIVYSITDGKTLFNNKCNLGIRVPMSATNNLQYDNLRESAKLSTGIQMGLNALSIVGMGVISPTTAVAGAGYMLSSGTQGIINSAVNYVNTTRNNYHHATHQVSSGDLGLYLEQTPFIKIIKKTPSYNYTSSDWAELFGRPYYQISSLSSTTGFVKCQNVKFQNNVVNQTGNSALTGDMAINSMTLTKNELNELIDILQDGFYNIAITP